MGVVKAYAYGHGNPECARTILEAGATRLGVARVAEALHLREAGISAPIHVFSEPPVEAASAFVEHDLIATVYTQAFALALDEAATGTGRRAVTHLKLDTGMHRVGIQADDLDDVLRSFKGLTNISLDGAWSHFAVADEVGHPFTKHQLALFTGLADRIESAGFPLAFRHIANSAATVSVPESHLDIVRCGIATYGLQPGPSLPDGSTLHPVMSLRSRISLVKELAEGEGVSYGLRYMTERRGKVVTVGAGYADGYDRRLSGQAPVLIGGNRYRVSGTVCMDQFMVDIGDGSAEVGSVATLLGADGEVNIAAEELAEMIGTINYEVTTRIPSRVPRIFKGEVEHEG
jgi:alanine racemase